MTLRILESNLNLRVGKYRYRGKNYVINSNSEVVLSEMIAMKQLSHKDNIDLYCNVEYMECQDENYLIKFAEKGYKRITALFGNDNRGILCYIKNDFHTRIISKKEEPHFLHFVAEKDNERFDVIVFRILVSDGCEPDFIDRSKQWQFVMNYIDTNIRNKSKLILTGDWNHAKIWNDYRGKSQRFFNYQMIRKDLEQRGLQMGIVIDRPDDKRHSYLGFLPIDHIAVGSALEFLETPSYSDYNCEQPIGIPDHAYLFAEINTKNLN